MKEIGQILQSARESRNLSLDDIQERTKIRKYYLQAIEEGNLSALPGLVYARGFIRNYADQVGVDGQELMREHGLLDTPVTAPAADTNSGEPKRVRPTSEEPAVAKHDVNTDPAQRSSASSQRTKANSTRQSTLLPQVMMGVAVIGLLGLGLWFLNNRPQAAEPPTSPSVQQPGSTPTPPPATTPQLNTPQPDPKTTEPLKADSKAASTSIFKVDGQTLKLELTAPNGECWVQVTIDGKLKESKTMPKGTTATYEGSNEIAVAAGLSPSLAVKINDRPVELEQIKDRYDYVFQKK